MDSQNNTDVGCIPSWSSAANWAVAGGCLAGTIAYESFDSPTNEQETVDSRPKSPLVLRRPSPESGPCEITIHFTKKHEIRQVYVRSTARVYEMYYTTNSQNENEYFCTVRCGAALRDDEVLHTNGIGDVSAHINGSDGDVAEANSQCSSNLSTNSDDWVEVKPPDGPALDRNNSSPASKSSADSVRIKQLLDLAGPPSWKGYCRSTAIFEDFFEATAEITDANPCTSLTIRLLSLQNKSIVYVHEVYVFANPVDLEEEGPVENSAQISRSSLMSMLVPTLLQLTKTTGSGKSNDGRTSNAEEIHTLPKVGSNPLNPTSSVTQRWQEGKSCATVDEVKLTEKIESDRPVRQPEVPLQVPVKESTFDEPLYRIESTLGQLVSRLDRIESLFLRFEENMLKPINSIEGRLKQVEQQLEGLTKEPHDSEWPSCYRMSAPSFSANESGSNSFYNSGNDQNSCEPIEPDRKELHSGPSPIALDIYNSVGSSVLRPSLVVTAPEFSNCDDDDDDDGQESVGVTAQEFSNRNDDGQENQVPEVAVDSLKSKPKPSIDEVLASALAQLVLSSSSMSTPEHTKTVGVGAPDLLNEDGNNHNKSFSGDLSTSELDDIGCSQEIDITQCTTNSSSASLSSADCGNLSLSRHDRTSIIDEGDDNVLNDPECKHQSADGNVGVVSAEQSMKAMEELGNVGVIVETPEDCVSEKGIPTHPLHHPLENEPDRTNVDVDTNEDTDTVEVTKEFHDIDIVQDVLGFSRDTSVVNFEIPILDVSFTSIADSNPDDSLKNLLGNMTESSYEASCLKESVDSTLVGEQHNLILVEEENQENATTTNCPLSVDMNYCTIMSEPLFTDGEIFQDYCNNTVISSLI